MRIIITIIAIIMCFSYSAKAIDFESGFVTLPRTTGTTSWTFIPFQDGFNTTPMVFILPDDRGGNPADIRIAQVSTTGFYALIVEPIGMDGPHLDMSVSYMAAEPGCMNCLMALRLK